MAPWTALYWGILVLSSQYDLAIFKFHQSLVAGYCGIEKVAALLQRQFVMHRVLDFVQKHVR